MIGLVGHMSGGKSYTAVSDLLQRLKAGHVVVSNIRLKCRGVSSYLGLPCLLWKPYYYFLCDNPLQYHEISIIDYKSWPMGQPRGSKNYNESMVFIYLDEVSSLFDSITHSSDSSIRDVAIWARHTMKRGQFVFLIMQFSSELHKRLRNHITEYWSLVNSSNLRIPVLNLRLPFFLRGYIIRTKYAGDEETLIENPKWFVIDSKIYSCYDTGQIVAGSSIGQFYALPNYTTTLFYKDGLLLWLLLFLNIILILALIFCYLLSFFPS